MHFCQIGRILINVLHADRSFLTCRFGRDCVPAHRRLPARWIRRRSARRERRSPHGSPLGHEFVLLCVIADAPRPCTPGSRTEGLWLGEQTRCTRPGITVSRLSSQTSASFVVWLTHLRSSLSRQAISLRIFPHLPHHNLGLRRRLHLASQPRRHLCPARLGLHRVYLHSLPARVGRARSLAE